MNKIISLCLLLTINLATQILVYADTQTSATSRLHNQFLNFDYASLVIKADHNTVYSRNGNTELVPASTVKVLTALRAIERWGLEHKFKTEFYLDKSNTLWIKGYGDPFLVSEELQRIAIKLERKLPKNTQLTLALDTSYFEPTLIVDGRGKTNNPYDAPLSALAVNFNTINIRKNGNYITSAEAQTPITPIAKQLAKSLSNGKQRINIGTQENALAYFAQLLQIFFNQHGHKVSANYKHGELPESAQLVYTHYNQYNLSHQIKGMLKYSNNFIANQLFMMMTDSQSHISIESAQQASSQYLKQNFGWDKTLYDGAGLSRKNTLSAEQLLSILTRFEPYKALMNCKAKICSKTGTLTGVSTLAGYIEQDDEFGKKNVPFALMINEAAPYNFRHNYINEWSREINSQ